MLQGLVDAHAKKMRDHATSSISVHRHHGCNTGTTMTTGATTTSTTTTTIGGGVDNAQPLLSSVGTSSAMFAVNGQSQQPGISQATSAQIALWVGRFLLWRYYRIGTSAEVEHETLNQLADTAGEKTAITITKSVDPSFYEEQRSENVVVQQEIRQQWMSRGCATRCFGDVAMYFDRPSGILDRVVGFTSAAFVDFASFERCLHVCVFDRFPEDVVLQRKPVS